MGACSFEIHVAVKFRVILINLSSITELLEPVMEGFVLLICLFMYHNIAVGLSMVLFL